MAGREIAGEGMTDETLEALTAPELTARHGFFTRKGGVSHGLYASLQCGWGAKEDRRAHVVENRRRVAAHLGADPARLVTAHQIHSAVALAVGKGPAWTPEDAPRADGLVSNTPGAALAALAADCAPVLFQDGSVVGACHAGWRGALDGVMEATLDAMVALGADRGRVRAVIGPCIGPDSYEVGPEYVARFTQADPANARFFRPAARAEHAYFDLPAYAQARLEAAGVAQARWIGRCTYAEPAHFFSNRRALHRGEDDYGRLISAIVAP